MWLVYPVSVIVLFYGIFLVASSFQFSNDIKASSNWTMVPGKLVQTSDGMSVGLGGIVGLAKVLICRPYIKYKYEVEGKTYEKEHQLPPCFTPVRVSVMRDLPADAIQDEAGSLVSAIDLASAPVRYNAQGEVDVEAIEKEFHKEREKSYPLVTVKYNPKEPQQSVTNPDRFRGGETLLWSGWTLIGVAIAAIGGMRFHAWASKPAPAPELKGRRSVKY